MNLGIAVHQYAADEGTGRYVVELLPRIAAVHRVTLYAARVMAPVPPGVDVVNVPTVTHRAYAAILSFPLGLRAVRRRHDLFHVQGWIASRADVVTAHIVMAAWREAARAWRVATPVGERTLGPFVQAREASLLRRASRVIAPSGKVREELARYYGRSEGVSLVYHGFPLPGGGTRPANPAAARAALGLPLDGTIALFVGDLRKGFGTAVEALRQVPGVRFAVVSRSAQRPAIERARHAGILDRFHWLGGLDQVAPAYYAADFLLHPTIYDAFGLVVAEAMAHGLPAVTTRAAGIAELIQHGKTGWVVEGDPAAGTFAAVQALTRDAGLRRRLGAGGLATASQRSWDDVAKETLTVYEEVAR